MFYSHYHRRGAFLREGDLNFHYRTRKTLKTLQSPSPFSDHAGIESANFVAELLTGANHWAESILKSIAQNYCSLANFLNTVYSRI